MRFVYSHEARAVMMAVWTNTLNAIVVFGLADMSAEQLATLTLVLSSYATLAGYIAARFGDRLQTRPALDDVTDEHQG